MWFNFRYLPLSQAVKMPVLIRTNMRIEKLKRGQILIEHPKRFSIMLGGGQITLYECDQRMFVCKQGW